MSSLRSQSGMSSLLWWTGEKGSLESWSVSILQSVSGAKEEIARPIVDYSIPWLLRDETGKK